MTTIRVARAATRRSFLSLCLATLLVAACAAGGGAATASPITAAAAGAYPGWPIGPQPNAALVPTIASSQLAVGPNRVLFSLTDAANHLLNRPELTTDLAFYDLAKDPATPAATSQGVFVWAIEGSLGLYHAGVTFGEAGDWGLAVTAHQAGQPDRTARVIFSVEPAATTPAIGAPVPAGDTPTATSAAGIAAISTDPHPDAAFYATSERQALADHRPFVLVFATPQFCQTAICGPTLDNVKAVAGAYAAKVTFMHVEPYVLQAQNGQLQPVLDGRGNLQLVPAAVEWGLPSEPWVFVVDGQGRLVAKFEGNFGQDELQAALNQVAGG